MKHVEISVDAIHPNPHRDFKRNPVRTDQVDRIVDSIGRTGFWDNVVVRPHPDKKGEYELAYGHTRLAAVKKCKIDTVRLPVADLSDWDMYQAMRDENETQQEITPAIAFENVEVGVGLMEKAFKEIGSEGTIEQFNIALGKVVSTDTTSYSVSEKSAFTQVRNHWFSEGTIGRKFITEVLEPRRLPGNAINTVLQSHYGKKIEEAKRKAAEAKRKAAAAKAARSRAAKDEKEAARLQAEAEAEQAEADELKAEAERIGAGFVAQDILLSFENPRQMTDFAAAIKAAGVAQEHHQAAMEHVKAEEAYGKKMGPAVEKWWYAASGQSEKDRKKREKDAAFKRFKKRVKDGDLHQFFLDIGQKVRATTAELKFASESALLLEHEKLRTGLCRDLAALIEQAQQMVANLSDTTDDPDVIDTELTNCNGRALPMPGKGAAATSEGECD